LQGGVDMGYRVTKADVTEVGTELATKLNVMLGCARRKGTCPSYLSDGDYVYSVQYGVYFKKRGSSAVGGQISGTCGASCQAFDLMRSMLRTIEFTGGCLGVKGMQIGFL
jgi:hypothetical protein